MSPPRLDAWRVRAWLLAQPAGSVVGRGGAEDGTTCPLAAYLAGDDPWSWDVGAFAATDWRGRRRRLPAWARRFVVLVDALAPADRSVRVTREAALACLAAAVGGDVGWPGVVAWEWARACREAGECD